MPKLDLGSVLDRVLGGEETAETSVLDRVLAKRLDEVRPAVSEVVLEDYDAWHDLSREEKLAEIRGMTADDLAVKLNEVTKTLTLERARKSYLDVRDYRLSFRWTGSKVVLDKSELPRAWWDHSEKNLEWSPKLVRAAQAYARKATSLRLAAARAERVPLIRPGPKSKVGPMLTPMQQARRRSAQKEYNSSKKGTGYTVKLLLEHGDRLWVNEDDGSSSWLGKVMEVVPAGDWSGVTIDRDTLNRAWDLGVAGRGADYAGVELTHRGKPYVMTGRSMTVPWRVTAGDIYETWGGLQRDTRTGQVWFVVGKVRLQKKIPGLYPRGVDPRFVWAIRADVRDPRKAALTPEKIPVDDLELAVEWTKEWRKLRGNESSEVNWSLTGDEAWVWTRDFGEGIPKGAARFVKKKVVGAGAGAFPSALSGEVRRIAKEALGKKSWSWG